MSYRYKQNKYLHYITGLYMGNIKIFDMLCLKTFVGDLTSTTLTLPSIAINYISNATY